MPDPNTEHGLRVQLATALRERDEAKACARTWAQNAHRAALLTGKTEKERDSYRTALQDIVTLCMDVPATEDWRKAVGDKARKALYGEAAWETK
jgi:hypothetical protein